MVYNLRVLVMWMMLCSHIYAEYEDPNYYTEYFPNGGETVKLEVNVLFNLPFYTKIFVRCKDFNSLNLFEINQNHLDMLRDSRGIRLEFIDCFDIGTDSENNNFALMTSFINLINSEATKTWDNLQVNLEEYAIVNSDVLFNNFNFQKFEDVSFENVGFKTTKMLRVLDCSVCTFETNNHIDFNDFGSELKAIEFVSKSNKLISFNKSNLKKFKLIRKLRISYFGVEDYNVFNTPDLFEHNPDLYELRIEDSEEKVTLSERIFSGLSYLSDLALQDLRLDVIHKDLFKDLTNLKTLYLSSNNIKRIEPTTFKNNNFLTFVTLTNNPIFTEPHNDIQNFSLGDRVTELWLGNFTVHTFHILEKLVKTTKLRKVLFQSMSIDPINLNEFTKFDINRERPITIKFLGDDVALELESESAVFNLLTDHQVNIDEYNMVLDLPIADESFWTNCALFKKIFLFYIDHCLEPPFIYFETSRVLVKPNVRASCQDFEVVFDEMFVDNCPNNCNCKYNPLLDKIKIDCSNKNLTVIPTIPYPEQYSKIHSIELNFENNSLTVLTLADQHDKLLKKLSVLLFLNNNIESVQLDVEQSKIIEVLDLCENPITSGNNSVQINGIDGDNYIFEQSDCRYGIIYPDATEYIQKEKAAVLDGFLDGVKCN